MLCYDPKNPYKTPKLEMSCYASLYGYKLPKDTFLALEVLINEIFKKSEIRRNCYTKIHIFLNFEMELSRKENFIQEKLFFANFV